MRFPRPGYRLIGLLLLGCCVILWARSYRWCDCVVYTGKSSIEMVTLRGTLYLAGFTKPLFKAGFDHFSEQAGAGDGFVFEPARRILGFGGVSGSLDPTLRYWSVGIPIALPFILLWALIAWRRKQTQKAMQKRHTAPPAAL